MPAGAAVAVLAGIVNPGILAHVDAGKTSLTERLLHTTGVLLRQAFAGIPQELPDSARVDGAGELRIFWHVMPPPVRPTLAEGMSGALKG